MVIITVLNKKSVPVKRFLVNREHPHEAEGLIRILNMEESRCGEAFVKAGHRIMSEPVEFERDVMEL